MYDFLFVCYCNSVPKTRRFSHIRLQIMSWAWNPGQRSLKVVESDIIRYIMYGFLLLSYSNFVPKTNHFLDIRLQKCRNFANRVRGPSRSLEMSPFDRARITSYWRSIVTMAVSRVVSEIFNVVKYRDLEIPVESIKVIESGTIR